MRSAPPRSTRANRPTLGLTLVDDGVGATGGEAGIPNARTTNTVVAAAIASAAATTRRRLGPRGGSSWFRPGPGARPWACVHRSGMASSSKTWKRVSNSSIAGLQRSSQSLSSLTEVHAHGRLRHAEQGSNLSRRESPIELQDHDGSLLGCQKLQRPDEVERQLRRFHDLRVHERNLAFPPAELTSRDAERNLPDPSLRRSEIVASRQGLGQRLSEGIVRDIHIARVRDERTPDLRPLRAVHALDRISPNGPHRSILLHCVYKGVESADPLRASGLAHQF